MKYLKIKKIKTVIFSLLTLFFIAEKSFCQESYFEKPVPLTEDNTQFPVVLNGENSSYLIYEENHSGQIFINMIKSADGITWSQKKVVAGPFKYYGEVPDIYTAAILKKGIISVAVTLSEYEIGVYTSKDGGETFSNSVLSLAGQRTVAPRIFATSNDGFVLFVSLGTEKNFSIAMAASPDGVSWSRISQFAPALQLDNSFSPYLCATENGDLVVFQSHFSVPDRPKTFQLYTAFSSDNLKTFSEPVLLTDDNCTVSGRRNTFVNFTNQSPVLYCDNNQIWCAWERKDITTKTDNTYITVTQINESGNLEGRKKVREYTEQKKSHRPIFYNYREKTNLLWFDENTQAYIAQKNSYGQYETEKRIKDSQKASFIYPLISAGQNELSYIWQKADKKNRIFIVNPDHTALKPQLTAVSFKNGKRSVQENVKVKITIPEDTNGIAGYVWSFSDDAEYSPSTQAADLIADNISSGKSFTINTKAPADGIFYFKARVQDVAGNWSDESVITYHRDLTPPGKVSFIDELVDEWGFEASSNVVIGWKSFEGDEDVAGYSWSLTKVQELDSSFKDSPYHPLKQSDEKIFSYFEQIEQSKEKLLGAAKNPPRSILTKDSFIRLNNYRNGIYVLSVCAIDEVGNIGEKEKKLVVINKYKPFTLISGLKVKKDIFGALVISVYGQDFNYEGSVNEIYIDRDGKAPYDRVLSLAKNEYKIESSSLISGIHLEDLDVGTYGVYLNHSQRGIYPSKQNLKSNRFIVDESGTVKIEHPYVIAPEWIIIDENTNSKIQIIDLLIAALILLSMAVAVFSLRGMAVVAKESIIIQTEVTALLNGDVMPSQKNEKINKLKKRQSSLKVKLIGFTVLLVLSIVLMVSVSLGRRMVVTQRSTLVESMKEQVTVLLEGMANSVQNAISDAVIGGTNTGVIDLVKQAESFKPAKYATLIGRGRSSNDSNVDYFWASTETSIIVSQKLDSNEPSAGRSRFNPETIEAQIAEKCVQLDKEAHEIVDDLIKQNSVEYSKERKEEYTNLLRELSRTSTKAIPSFDTDSLATDNEIYTFYYPVFYKNNDDNDLLHAILILQVSAEELVDSLYKAKMAIIVLSVIIAIIAIVLGCVGAWILASLIVEPIKKLVSHVKIITDTKDKKLLKDFLIHVKTRDEIGTLGDAVNEMTSGLVKAAEDEEKAMKQEKMALDGKAVQQTFLPLLMNQKGGKQTTAELKEKDFHIFGYYEGADAVSGDYFDFKKLDDRFYAIIKCDVSGHGVPAALMMTVVATLFRKYFENWSFKTHGTSLDKLVVQINDFIESLGVKGKFATLMICLFDTKTGDVFMSNAGDNIIHVFDQNSRKEKVITLHEAPAAGPLPSFMVEMKGGFIVEKTHLNKGDVLFLYTDGIEEATRFFRNKDFEVVKCAESGMEEGEIHLNHKVGQDTEQMEPERVKGILEAVLNKSVYKLVKYHCPDPSEELVFDFTSLEGNVDEAIMCLAAVERVFRIYKTPGANGQVSLNDKGDIVLQGDGIKIDRKIDEVLKKTFNRYDYYFSERVDMEEPNYVYFTGVNEDPQADDLTLLAVRKL